MTTFVRLNLVAVILTTGLTVSAGELTTANDAPGFRTDIVPILTRYGCNSGGCHGKATGQNGFRLSLLGFEPDFDHVALVHEARGRRVFAASPDESLLLSKASGRVPHGGGLRIRRDSEDYDVLRQWIQSGSTGPHADEPTLIRLTVSPQQQVLEFNSTIQLTVTAHFSNERKLDVTGRSLFETNLPQIAEVDESGELQTHNRGGLVAAMVRFGGKIAVFRGTVPFRRDASDASTPVEPTTSDSTVRRAAGVVNSILAQQWNRLGVTPSEPASDFEFIRRAAIDICGTLPTADEVREFAADKRPNKKALLIDRLLERSEHASWFALKWAAILQNRGKGYSTRQQREGTALFTSWIRDSIAENKPCDRFVTEILTATGSQQQSPPTLWYRSVRTTQDYVESVAQSFLGVRIQCAQCHHHPAERWTQSDYYSLAAVFARVGRKGGFADAEVPTSEVLYLKDRGEVAHPRTGEIMQPRPLGGEAFTISRYDDPRHAFAQWMTAKSNPFFARTMVNRMWGHFLRRGIIHPIDDARSTNPPSNPELLEFLAHEFAASHYDVRHLIRVIANSHAYELSSTPNTTNRLDLQSYSRFYPRRLAAEVLLDGISQVLEVPTTFPGGPGTFPAGTRAIDLPDENVTSNFLDVFGRPARTTACECERSDEPALAQALELVNSSEIQRKLSHKDGYVANLISNDEPHVKNVGDIFLRIFARSPTQTELETAVDFLKSESDRGEGYRSLVWSLLATNEFMFNH